MPKRITESVRNQVIDLYVTHHHSIASVANILRGTIGCNAISNVLREQNLLRTHDEAIKMREKRFVKCVCAHCKQEFAAKRAFAKFCKQCAPTGLAWRRLVNYGLSQGDVDELLKRQYASCALCRESFDTLPRHENKDSAIVVDHDHESGVTRGLLCSECNVTLGHIEKKSHEWLERARSYVAAKKVEAI